jgi:hypothetical protein
MMPRPTEILLTIGQAIGESLGGVEPIKKNPAPSLEPGFAFAMQTA